MSFTKKQVVEALKDERDCYKRRSDRYVLMQQVLKFVEENMPNGEAA